MLKICIVKQNTTYDLYTKAGPDLRSILESSNWRCGPIGLWEIFDCDVRFVTENLDAECQIGKKQWSRYVEGWNIWPEDGYAEPVEAIDWSVYNIVISIDVAVPSRIIKKYPKVMWCYYFIETGFNSIDTIYYGSPFYGYNVFLTQRLAKEQLIDVSPATKSMLRTRRSILDFPYYILSSKFLQKLYPEYNSTSRSGMYLSHHSYEGIKEEEWNALQKICEIKGDGNNHPINDIHKLALTSKYLVVHPNSTRKIGGLALIEAISAGCLVVAPVNQVIGFPELLSEESSFSTFSGLIQTLQKFEEHQDLYEIEKALQGKKVDEWCFENPTQNLKCLYDSFIQSQCSTGRQYLYEKQDFFKALLRKVIASASRRLNQPISQPSE